MKIYKNSMLLVILFLCKIQQIHAQQEGYWAWYCNGIKDRAVERTKLLSFKATYGFEMSKVSYTREELPLLVDAYNMTEVLKENIPSLLRPYLGNQIPQPMGSIVNQTRKWEYENSILMSLPIVSGQLTIGNGRLSPAVRWKQLSSLRLFAPKKLLKNYIADQVAKPNPRFDFKIGIKPIQLVGGLREFEISKGNWTFSFPIEVSRVWSLDLSYKAGLEIIDENINFGDWLKNQTPNSIEQVVDVKELGTLIQNKIESQIPSYVFGLPYLKGWGVDFSPEWLLEKKNVQMKVFADIKYRLLSNGLVGSPTLKTFQISSGISLKLMKQTIKKKPSRRR